MTHPKKFSAWGVIFKGEQYLFIKRSPNTSRPNQWCLPGGGNKSDETPAETCVREVKEEVGLDVVVTDCLMKDNGFYFFQCRLKNETQNITLQSKECADCHWAHPERYQSLGFIMELKKMKRLFQIINETIH